MNDYQQPHHSDAQIYWDIDGAINALKQAANAQRTGDCKTTNEQLADAAFCIREALEKLGK